MPTTYETRQKLLGLKDQIAALFKKEDWLNLGLLTGFEEQVQGHGRLLRSLYFGDEDYPGEALNMLLTIVNADERNFAVIETYLSEKFGLGGISVSSVVSPGRRIYFTPDVFQVPDDDPDPLLVSVMMPFSAQMQPVFESIKEVCDNSALTCQRANDIWQHSAIIQDIFRLIYCSHIVICDFSGKNPNVFYEAGIAHTLGKHVIPLAQNIDDVPFDLRHHRVLTYLNNAQGLKEMQGKLVPRIATLLKQSKPRPTSP